MYEPSGRVAARSAIVVHSDSSQPKPSVARSAGEPSGSKQLRVPRWHVGPTGSTATSSASRSQSSAMSTRRSTLPLDSPFRHRLLRDREWKWTSYVASVALSASSSIQASISTRPSAASWTIAGTSPSSPY